MFVILYYDVAEKRCNKMLKLCRQFLVWVQNSVFEGEITKAGLEKLKIEIEKIINYHDGDSVIIYEFRTTKYSRREVIGQDKKQNSFLI